MKGATIASQMMSDDAQRHAHQELAERHLPLVAALVRRVPHDVWEAEELYQQGCIGLMKAIARFDPTRGVAFATYATPLILGEMRMLRRLGAPIHIPRPERELRQRIRRTCTELTRRLGREPTVQELAANLRMDAAEMVLLMEEVTVTSTDALSDQGTPLQDTLADDSAWLCQIELSDMITRLPPQDRQLMLLRCRDGLSQADTARRLSMTQVQVSRREAMIRKSLRKSWWDA